MRYVIGVDGGGTKSVCALANENGEILNISMTGCTNHQICGFETAIQLLTELIDQSIGRTGLKPADVHCVYLGLAGADFVSDVEKLNSAIKNKFPNLRIKVVNDIWLAFASGIHEGWGAVSICGTGHNAAVIMPDGKMLSIWALKETIGNWGGGRQLTDQAMHHAFRSYQKTGVYTRLEERLPELCNVSDMDELAYTIYNSVYEYQYQYPVPSLVFQLANEGDAVCCQLIRSMGLEIGEILGGLLRKSQLSAKTVPVALGGALFCGENNQLLIDSFREGLSDTAPAFDFRILKNPPVMGALILALNDIGIPSDDRLVSVLSDNTLRLFSQVKDGGD